MKVLAFPASKPRRVPIAPGRAHTASRVGRRPCVWRALKLVPFAFAATPVRTYGPQSIGEKPYDRLLKSLKTSSLSNGRPGASAPNAQRSVGGDDRAEVLPTLRLE